MNEEIFKLFNGELSFPERDELWRKIEADNKLKLEYISIQNISALSHLVQSTDGKIDGENTYLDFKKRIIAKCIRRITLSTLKYAAAIAIIVISSVFVTMHFTRQQEPIIADNTLYVPAGQRARIVLQDGTEVWLNAQTTMVYPSQFTGRTRNVSISGEAYLNVAKNDNMPFVVSSGDIDIKVLGTTFNMQNYPETGFIQTSLIEGSVEVFSKGNRKATVTLQPNEQVTIRDNKFLVEKITFPNHFLWRTGIYCFDNESFSDIINKLEMYFNVNIIVENTKLNDFRYTGKFKQTDGIDKILEILQHLQYFSINKNSEGDIITIK